MAVSLRNDLPNTERLLQIKPLAKQYTQRSTTMIIPWPMRWIDRTFTSRAKTEELLRPELENSLVSGDFEKAVEFLPSSQRHWKVACGLAASSILSCYGVYLRKPAWSFTRTTTLAVLAGFSGSLAGQTMRFRAHSEFVHSLEDRQGFMRSLSNVGTRLGSAGSMRVDIDEARVLEAFGFPEDVPSSAESISPDSTTTSPTKISPTGQWDEIRTANARNAGRSSSWDALRQKHERDRVARTEDASSSTESDRAQEQARFDAMLEAERRRGSS